MNEKIVNFRIDENLKTAFEMVANARDLTSSQLLRALMRNEVDSYMQKNAQLSLIGTKDIKPKTKPKQKSVIPDSWRKK
jgi:bacterioferritin (cytochrome b1)